MIEDFTLSVEVRKHYFFGILGMGIIVFQIIIFSSMEASFATWILAFFVYVYLIYFLGRINYKRCIISINELELSIENKLFGVSLDQNKYPLNGIAGIRTCYDEKSENWSSIGPSFSINGGVGYTPERFREYELNPTVLYFTYDGKEIKIGEGLEEFDVEKLKFELEKRINRHDFLTSSS
jgi:hypothetical protein